MRARLAQDGPRIVLGNGSSMTFIADDAVDLIVTSPPYFPSDVDLLLHQPRKLQRNIAFVRRRLVEHAFSLRPVFLECARVLKGGSAFVVQTKDIRFGGRLISLASIHRDLAESCGFDLVTRVFWQRTHAPVKHGSPTREARRAMTVGEFVAPDVEEFLVFKDSTGTGTKRLVEASADEVISSMTPLWRLPGPGGRRRHPYASPASVVRRFILLFSNPGDLVIDPFAGSGTTLNVAHKLGRRAIGYDINSTYAFATSHTRGFQ